MKWWKVVDEDKRSAALALHEMYEKGVKSAEIGRVLQVHYVTILNLFREFNLPLKSRGGPHHKPKINITKKEYLSMTYEEIARRKGISTSSVNLFTRRFRQEGLRKKGVKKSQSS